MRVFEFEDNNPLRIKLASVASQLRGRINDENSELPFSVKSLLKVFGDSGITIDKDDLLDMIKKEPLKNIIDNVKGDDVIFKGQKGSKEPKSDEEEDDQEKIVKKMANSAAGL